MAINVDFKFDFEKHLNSALADSYQDIAYIAKGLEMKSTSVEKAIRSLIEINVSAISKVLNAYNKELLNDIEL